MPNNVTNLLAVGGKPKDVSRFFDDIDGGTDEDGERLLIDFNKIKPMPAALDIEKGSNTDRALDYYVLKLSEQSGSSAIKAALGKYAGAVFKRLPETLSRQRTGKDTEDMPELLRLGEQCFNNIRNYGVPTWYEWCIEHWGTKWNAYNQDLYGDGTIAFDTAWGAVPDLLQELSARYPEIALSYTFADEDWGNNAGEYAFRLGDCVRENVPKDGSAEAKRIATEIHGNPYAEENEDDWEQEDDE